MKKSIVNKIYMIGIIYLLLIIFILIVDYFNVFDFISSYLNFDFLNIFINTITIMFMFLVTYFLIDKKSIDIRNNTINNKTKVLFSLLVRTYKKCLDNIVILEN